MAPMKAAVDLAEAAFAGRNDNGKAIDTIRTNAIIVVVFLFIFSFFSVDCFLSEEKIYLFFFAC